MSYNILNGMFKVEKESPCPLMVNNSLVTSLQCPTQPDFALCQPNCPNRLTIQLTKNSETKILHSNLTVSQPKYVCTDGDVRFKHWLLDNSDKNWGTKQLLWK